MSENRCSNCGQTMPKSVSKKEGEINITKAKLYDGKSLKNFIQDYEPYKLKQEKYIDYLEERLNRQLGQ